MEMNIWFFNIILRLIIAFALTSIIMPLFIPLLRRLKFGQSIRQEGPQSHLKKQGTPTMGGVVFVSTTILTMVITSYNDIISRQFLAITSVFLGYFAIGLLDDYLIVVYKKNDGLSAKLKIVLQILIALIFFIIVYSTFIKDANGMVSVFNKEISLGNFYLAFIIFMFVAYSNALNLTDGMDGLSSMTMIIALSFITVIGIYQGNALVVYYIVSLIGALLGFYRFNKSPAKIFMGDTGSLALGGFYAV
ncbi:MAG: phospho-N-acetylmuramoyl-pentapeptide-transferase, partial [Bacilli bacterium]